MIATLRWVAFLILTIAGAVAYTGVRSWLLAGIMLAAFLILVATFGAFSKSVWFGTPEEDETCAAIDQQLEAIERHEAWREQRHRRLNP